MPLLEARGVSKRFGGLTALNAVDFTLEEGHIASIIGPNGAGKTTFFNVFTGIYVPEEGTVLFRDTSVLGRRPDQITDRVTATRLGIDENDLWIAAQAVQYNLALVTNDGMARIRAVLSELAPSLHIENWTKPTVL